jgi:hypothetical protein
LARNSTADLPAGKSALEVAAFDFTTLECLDKFETWSDQAFVHWKTVIFSLSKATAGGLLSFGSIASLQPMKPRETAGQGCGFRCTGTERHKMKRIVVFLLTALFGLTGCEGSMSSQPWNEHLHMGVGPGREIYSYTDNQFSDACHDNWSEVAIFINSYRPDNALSFSNRLLENYYGDKEDVSSGGKGLAGGMDFTESLTRLKSEVSKCEIRLETVAQWRSQLQYEVDKSGKMLAAVDQARADLASIKKAIASFEKRAAEVRQAKESELKGRQMALDRLATEEENPLIYSDEGVRVELMDVFVRRDSSVKSSTFNVKLRLTILSKTRIVQPNVGYYSSSDTAHTSSTNENVIIVDPGVVQVPRGIALQDNFGNTFRLSSIDPFSISPNRLRPGESKIFTATFDEEPLQNTEWLTLTVDQDTFGNPTNFEFKLPKPLIGAALEDQHATLFPPAQGG